jgi:ATP-binding cassette subfamily F protein uup
MPLLQLKRATVGFGDAPVLEGVNLTLEQGERLCLLGRNGTGKSTLLAVLRGALELDEGEMIADPGLRVAAVEQIVPSDLEGTALEVATSGVGTGMDTEVSLHAAQAALSRVGVPEDAEVDALSAGLKRRVLLAAALATEPDLLLLDEPTNHLDIEAIKWLEDFLTRGRRSLLFVTHDRAFLRRVATGILDLDRGQLTRYDADYDRYLEIKTDRHAVEARGAALFDKRLAEEEAWIRQGVRERRKRNQGRVRSLMAMRQDRVARREHTGRVSLEASSANPSGRVVIRVANLDFDWEGKPFVRDFSTTISRGDRVGIIGPNGSGKTTLLRLLLGDLQPAAGTVKQGTNLEVAYFDQLHSHLDLDATAAQNVSPNSEMVRVAGKERHIIGYLRDFLFTADQARSPIRKFSGGERNRLLLARLFLRPSNLLVLDEPTNDLDAETLEVLESMLADYAGTVLIVSHDRTLLDNVVTQVMVMEGDGKVGEYVGGYSDWFRQQAAAAKAAAPAKQGKRRGNAPKASALNKAEREELRVLPARIEKLEAEQQALHTQMGDPAFFRRPGPEIAAAQERLAAIGGEIEAVYARWEALEEKRSTAD